jgi:pyruvate,water dikinase
MLPVIKLFCQIGMNKVPFKTDKRIVATQLTSNLCVDGINIPEGFVIAVEAYKIFLAENNLQHPITETLKKLDIQKFSNIVTIGKAARQLILDQEMPHQLAIEIRNAHYNLCGEESDVSVTLQASATIESLHVPLCAQPLQSFENIKGEDNFVTTVQKCFASLFTEKAIYNRFCHGSDNAHSGILIAVKKIKKNHYSSPNFEFPFDPLKSFNKIMSFKTVKEI